MACNAVCGIACVGVECGISGSIADGVESLENYQRRDIMRCPACFLHVEFKI